MSNYPVLGPIIIGITEVERSKAFYQTVFGVVVEEEKDNYIKTRAADGTIIELEQDSADRFPNWAQNNIGTYKNSEFKVIDLNLFLDTVVSNGGKIVSAPKRASWGGLGAEITDPDGNTFLITEI